MSLATGTVNDPTPPAGAWANLSNVVNEVPTHALVGRLPRVFPSSSSIWWLNNFLFPGCGLSFEKVFGQDSDGVVSVGSQADSLGGYTTPIAGVDHLNVTDSEEVVERVKVLLDGEMNLFAPAAGP